VRGSARLWAAASVLALATTVTLAVVVKAKLKAAAHERASLTRDLDTTTLGCSVPPVVPLRAQPDAENPPVLLWAVGNVRILLDGVPAFSSPEAPKHFKTGEHSLRVEADGLDALKTRVRLDAFTPALFHAERDGELGLTLVRAGSFCVSCAQPLNVVSLDYERSGVRPAELLGQAATALRTDAWAEAGELLRGIPPPQRTTAAFHRLASTVYLGGLALARSHEELELIPEKASNDLRGLLRQLDALTQGEQQRRAEVIVARWNKVTERFQGLIHRFNSQAPGPTALASQRIAKLSDAFEEARKKSDLNRQEEFLRSAEEALLQVVVQIRAARPEDCDFQANVVTTVIQ
jgi:hypothetical protein